MKIGTFKNALQVDAATTLATDQVATTASEAESNSFSTYLSRALARRPSPSSPSEVSEEELFAGVTETLISQQKGQLVATEFRASYRSNLLLAAGSPQGTAEEATKATLAELVDAGALTQNDATNIQEKAFMSSQLDEDSSLLYDHIAEGSDITRAVADLSTAIESASQLILGNAPPENEPSDTPQASENPSVGDGEVTSRDNEVIDDISLRLSSFGPVNMSHSPSNSPTIPKSVRESLIPFFDLDPSEKKSGR
jgi:hypothetical protein